MPATTIHADDIIDKLKTTIGSTAGIINKWEAYPLPWPADNKLPLALFHLANFNQVPRGTHYNQTYIIDVFYIRAMDDGNTSEPEKYIRQQAELIVDQITTNKALGGDGTYYAYVIGFTPENELTNFFRAENQSRICYQITVQVECVEDGS
jgi:hypothetical protein